MTLANTAAAPRRSPTTIAGTSLGRTARSVVAAVAIALGAVGGARGADFRLMHIDSHDAHIVDLSAIGVDQTLRHVISYESSDVPHPVYQRPGVLFLYAAFEQKWDCQTGEVMLEKIVVMDESFAIVDTAGGNGAWFKPRPSPEIDNEWTVFCAAAPSEASHDQRLDAHDWRGALLAAHALLLARH